MADDTTTDEVIDHGPHGRIEPVEIQTEMQRSYLDYAMSVIVGRALPAVADGLGPLLVARDRAHVPALGVVVEAHV